MIQNKLNRPKTGFTLIELMLSMSFVSVLLIAIAATTIQIGNIYNKGTSLRAVNQAGLAISTELQTNINQVTPFDISAEEGPDSHYIIRDGGGRLCTGQYTYAWNYGDSINAGEDAPAIYNQYAGTPDDEDVPRFVKVYDPDSAYCSEPEKKIAAPGEGIASTVEMLTGQGRDLAIHKFNIVSENGAIDKKTGQRLYDIEFILGTNDQAELTTNDRSCQPPSGSSNDSAYCAVNVFRLTARAGNR